MEEKENKKKKTTAGAKTKKKATSKPAAKKTTKTVKTVKAAPSEKKAVKKSTVKKETSPKPVIDKETQKREVQIKKEEKEHQIVEEYKRRNRDVIYTILVVLTVILSILIINKTFFRTEYVKKIDQNTELTVKLPRFSYFVSDRKGELTFMTIRRKSVVDDFLDDYLQNNFMIYNCADHEGAVYYSSEGRFSLYDVEVKRGFLTKTITLKYDIPKNENTVCDVFN